jgi:hypothetical protein
MLLVPLVISNRSVPLGLILPEVSPKRNLREGERLQVKQEFLDSFLQHNLNIIQALVASLPDV